MSFRIITPVYNAENWIGKCIQSVKKQRHEDFIQVIVNDGSTDKTLDCTREAVGRDKRIIILNNPSRLGTGHSHFIGHKELSKISDDEDIFVHLDGDDWFAHDNVLNVLEDTYRKKDVWVTYGNYRTTDGSPSICKDWNRKVPARMQILRGWHFSHLRTYKKFLWDKVELGDLTDRSGKFLTSAADTAIMSPILELAGDRVEYIDQILCVYNRDNPLNVHKDRLSDQYRCALEVVRKPRKLPLVKGCAKVNEQAMELHIDMACELPEQVHE